MTFEAFGKIARLNRDCIITEKLDGTNAQVIVEEDGTVGAASRTRLITPEDDNAGFARWVQEHVEELRLLGPGRHFGEWWGQKIQRGYGLTEKRFSLFNTSRWASRHVPVILEAIAYAPSCCHVVPVLYEGPFTTTAVEACIQDLRTNGSRAVPGFMRPEGVVVFHVAARMLLKVTLEKDEAPKGRVSCS